MHLSRSCHSLVLWSWISSSLTSPSPWILMPESPSSAGFSLCWNIAGAGLICISIHIQQCLPKGMAKVVSQRHGSSSSICQNPLLTYSPSSPLENVVLRSYPLLALPCCPTVDGMLVCPSQAIASPVSWVYQQPAFPHWPQNCFIIHTSQALTHISQV